VKRAVAICDPITMYHVDLGMHGACDTYRSHTSHLIMKATVAAIGAGHSTHVSKRCMRASMIHMQRTKVAHQLQQPGFTRYRSTIVADSVSLFISNTSDRGELECMSEPRQPMGGLNQAHHQDMSTFAMQQVGRGQAFAGI
jgi:hypothetical protein